MPTKKVAETEPTNEDVLHHNMRFYGKVQNTPPEAQKEFNNGRFSGTDINPMWRIKKLTEVFGPAGIGWWTQNVNYEFVKSEQTDEVVVFCNLELIVVDPETGAESHPIYGVGGNTLVAQRKSGPQCSDEAEKMAYTDALSIACKALGFSHDIYYAKDRTKYTNPDNPEDNIQKVKEITDRIQKGIGVITKGMTKEEKEKFSNDVVVKHIGGPNYMTCRDIPKLQALLDELLAMATKA